MLFFLHLIYFWQESPCSFSQVICSSFYYVIVVWIQLTVWNNLFYQISIPFKFKFNVYLNLQKIILPKSCLFPPLLSNFNSITFKLKFKLLSKLSKNILPLFPPLLSFNLCSPALHSLVFFFNLNFKFWNFGRIHGRNLLHSLFFLQFEC